MSQKIVGALAIGLLLQGCFLTEIMSGGEDPLNENMEENLQDGEFQLGDTPGAALETEDLSGFTPSTVLKAQLDPTPKAQVQLSGVVSAFAVSSSKLLNNDSGKARQGLGSTSRLTGAQVALRKRFADSSKAAEVVATTTTDANGAYNFSDVAAAVTGQGEDQDFYYEVVATSGDTELAAPVAPVSDDAGLDISPESNIAANIVKDVIKVPGATKRPVPSFRSMRNLSSGVGQNMYSLRNSISVPNSSTANASGIKAAANGIASTGGNAEKMYKSYQFNSEWVRLTKSSTSTEAQFSNYLKRIAREQCGQNGNDPLPQIAADALAKAAKDGVTFNPTGIVAAINAANSQAGLEVDYAVKRYAYLLDQIEHNLVKSSTEATDFSDKQMMALFSLRKLRSYDLNGDSTLDADQALSFLQYVGNTGGDGGSGDGGATGPAPGGDGGTMGPPLNNNKVANRATPPNEPQMCQMSANTLITTIASLVNDPSLTQPAIADAQIFHDSGHGCDQNAGLGHFRAEISVYAGNTSVSSVSVSSTDTSALGGDGNIAITEQFGGKYRTSLPNECVTLEKAVTYTVTATMADGSSVSQTYDRTHPLVHETQARYNGVDMSKGHDTATRVGEYRPTITWDSTTDMLSRITTAPTGSQVKYSYEFSYVDTSVQQIGPVSQCDTITSGGALYAVDSFMPTVDCNPTACATASGISKANLQCRIYIDTFLVDGADRILGQSAGNFTYYCVDENKDGQCDS